VLTSPFCSLVEQKPFSTQEDASPMGLQRQTFSAVDDGTEKNGHEKNFSTKPIARWRCER
jgi:hypothetical protein